MQMRASATEPIVIACDLIVIACDLIVIACDLIVIACDLVGSTTNNKNNNPGREMQGDKACRCGHLH